MSERVAATTTRSGATGLCGSGWSARWRRWSTSSRRPTVSIEGERRSCGSVSQLGKNATSSPRYVASSAVSSSPSWPVAVTTRRGVRVESADSTSGRAASLLLMVREGAVPDASARSSCRAGLGRASLRRAWPAGVSRCVSCEAGTEGLVTLLA